MTRTKSGHYEIPGTDRFENCEQTFGREYEAYRRKWNEYPKKRIVNEFPLHLDIEVTNACNLTCTVCPFRKATQKTGYMNWDLFAQIIDEGVKYRLPSIKLCFRGEPLLHPQLPRMVAYAKRKGVLEVQFNTNGLLLSDEKTVALLNAGLDRIIFSLDGASKQTYENIRIGSEYETVIKNIKKLIAIRSQMRLRKPSVRLQMVKRKEGKEGARQFLETWMNIANQVAFNLEVVHGGKGEEERFPCPMLWQRMSICWDGEVRGCCGDWHGKLVLGNVAESNLHELWHSEKLTHIRELHGYHRFEEIPACAQCGVNRLKIDSEIEELAKEFA